MSDTEGKREESQIQIMTANSADVKQKLLPYWLSQ